MELKARLKNVYQNIIDDCTEAVFEVVDFDSKALSMLTSKEQFCRLKITNWSEKRSLNANAYFHKLCDELRQACGVSMANMKNDLITTYGQIEYISEGVPLIYKTNAPPEYMQEREEIHAKFIKPSDDGAFYYRLYRGTHTYNSKEMSQLIDGTVIECKAHDIETLPPEEIERLKRDWVATPTAKP